MFIVKKMFRTTFAKKTETQEACFLHLFCKSSGCRDKEIREALYVDLENPLMYFNNQQWSFKHTGRSQTSPIIKKKRSFFTPDFIGVYVSKHVLLRY
jgi:hypothetical protein